jgi:hypothetical protein
MPRCRSTSTAPPPRCRVEGTWPQIELYGPGYTAIWRSLYDRFGIEFESSLDLGQPDEYWRRYLYFNAGFFYYRCPQEFGARFLEIAQTASATTRRRSWSARPSTHGSTRSRCPW